MKKAHLILVTLLLMTVIVFAACARQGAPTPVPTPVAVAPTPAVGPVPQAPARQAWEVEWEGLMAKARKEGSVVVYWGMLGSTARFVLTQAVRDKLGLRLESMVGRAAEATEKILSERRAGLYLSDLIISGASPAVTPLKPAGALDPLEPTFIFPELTQPALIEKTWWGGRLPWVDPDDRKIFAFLAYPSPAVAINTNLVKPEEIKSYRNLLELRWKGKMTLNDPTTAGTGQKWFTMVGVGVKGKPLMGLDFMQELIRQEVVIVRDARLQIDWLAQGKYPIALAPSSGPVADFIKAGAPIQVVTPEEGSYLTAGVGAIALLGKAAHPNAARVFINWLLTREGQTLFSRAQDAQSARLDVPAEYVSPAKRRDPQAKYVWSDTEELLLGEPERIKLAMEIFRPLLK